MLAGGNEATRATHLESLARSGPGPAFSLGGFGRRRAAARCSRQASRPCAAKQSASTPAHATVRALAKKLCGASLRLAVEVDRVVGDARRGGASARLAAAAAHEAQGRAKLFGVEQARHAQVDRGAYQPGDD
jgi:hypothetical protein